MSDESQPAQRPLFNDALVINALRPRHGETRRQWRGRLYRLERQALLSEQFAREVDDSLAGARGARHRELIARSIGDEDFWKEPVVWKGLFWPEPADGAGDGE